MMSLEYLTVTISIKALISGIIIQCRAIYLIQFQPGDTCEMTLIAKKAASLGFVIPLRLGGRRRKKEVGQNELKRFTGICAAGKMAWQWKTWRKADSGPVGPHINTGIRQKRAWLCIYAPPMQQFTSLHLDNIPDMHPYRTCRAKMKIKIKSNASFIRQ